MVMDLDPYLTGAFERSALPFIDHLVLVAYNGRSCETHLTIQAAPETS